MPVDFGSTAVTGIHVSVVAALRKYFGLEDRPVKVHEPYQMLGLIEEDLQDALGVDTQGIFGRNTIFGFPLEKWKEFTTPWGQKVLVPERFRVTRTGEGDLLMHPQGDREAPPSAKMPSNGMFFDSLIRQKSINGEVLDPKDNLEEFGAISEQDLGFLARETDEAAVSGRGIVATFGGTAIGDIALVPGPALKDPKGIRDITEWYVSTVMRRDYLHEVFAKQVDIALANLEGINKRIGPGNIDVVYICGTDFGTQTSSFCAPEAYDELYAPYYTRINRWIHENTDWKTFKHSCGAVKEFIPKFIESGFDILNPLQFSASGMDPKELKKEYGKDIVFWGGGVDTQKTLPFGTPEEVRSQVLSRCETLSRGGGFVFNTIHNVQAKTPLENFMAMIEAVHEFNGGTP